MKKLLFVFNPYSGKRKVIHQLDIIISVFSNAGYDVDKYETKAPLDGKKYVGDNGKNYDLIVCAGGDGTLNEIVSAVYEQKIDVPLGYLPCGSTNDLGSSLGLSKNLQKSSVMAITGQKCKIDIGTFNNRPFVYVAAFGAFTDTTYTTPQKLKNILGHGAYILYGIKNIFCLRSYDISAKWTDGKDEHEISGRFMFGMVSNSKSIGGFKNLVGKDVSLDDGEYEVTFIKKISSVSDIKNIVMTLLGSNKKFDNILRFKAVNVEIASKDGIAWTLDGESGGKVNKADIINHKKAITVLMEGNA